MTWSKRISSKSWRFDDVIVDEKKLHFNTGQAISRARREGGTAINKTQAERVDWYDVVKPRLSSPRGESWRRISCQRRKPFRVLSLTLLRKEGGQKDVYAEVRFFVHLLSAVWRWDGDDERSRLFVFWPGFAVMERWLYWRSSGSFIRCLY